MEGSDDADADAALLAEMVREAERVIDHQVSVLKELDRKSGLVTTVAQALLAGAVILITLVTAQEVQGVDVPFIALLSSGGLVNVVALVRSLDAFVGPRQHEAVKVGPDIRWVRRRSQEEGWGATNHRLSVISGLAAYQEDNLGFMGRKLEKVWGTLRLLSAAVGLYAASLLYLLWKPELL